MPLGAVSSGGKYDIAVPIARKRSKERMSEAEGIERRKGRLRLRLLANSLSPLFPPCKSGLVDFVESGAMAGGRRGGRVHRNEGGDRIESLKI